MGLSDRTRARFWQGFLATTSALMIASLWTVQGILLLIGVVVLFWPWFSSFALLVLRPLFSREVFYSIPVFALPIRNVASLPFAVIALLACSWKSGVGMREA